MVSYFAFRLLVDFLKPAARFAALSAIQWAAAGGLIYYAIYYARARQRWRGQALAMTVEKVSPHGHA